MGNFALGDSERALADILPVFSKQICDPHCDKFLEGRRDMVSFGKDVVVGVISPIQMS